MKTTDTNELTGCPCNQKTPKIPSNRCQQVWEVRSHMLEEGCVHAHASELKPGVAEKPKVGEWFQVSGENAIQLYL